MCTEKTISMTLPDGLNKCIVLFVVLLLFFSVTESTAAACLIVVRNMLCPYKHIIFVFKQQGGEKKKPCFSCIPEAYDWRDKKNKIICCCSFGSNPSIELNGNTHWIPACDSTHSYKGPPDAPYGIWGRFSLESSKDFLKFLNEFRSEGTKKTASRWSVCHLVQIEQLSQEDVIWLKAVFKSRGNRSCSKDHRSQQNTPVSSVQFGVGSEHEKKIPEVQTNLLATFGIKLCSIWDC